MRLDAYTWDALRELCSRENITPHMLYQTVAESIPRGLSFTVAVRRHGLTCEADQVVPLQTYGPYYFSV